MALPSKHIWIFTDGACSGNPGPGGWAAIIRWPDDEVQELGGGEPRATNNRMELMAALRALEHARERAGGAVHALVFTDSTYLIRGMTEWAPKWEAKGWPEDLANRTLWQALWDHRAGVEWHHVAAHAGIPGNERVDTIAVAYTHGQYPSLYQGPRAQYDVDLEIITSRTAGVKSKSRSRSKTPGVYLSLVDGQFQRHRDWKSCEAVVKGRSGARFQKAVSPEEEAEICARWGVIPPEDR